LFITSEVRVRHERHGERQLDVVVLELQLWRRRRLSSSGAFSPVEEAARSDEARPGRGHGGPSARHERRHAAARIPRGRVWREEIDERPGINASRAIQFLDRYMHRENCELLSLFR